MKKSSNMALDISAADGQWIKPVWVAQMVLFGAAGRAAQDSHLRAELRPGGAVDLFGPKYGLPKAITGHQTYCFWGRAS